MGVELFVREIISEEFNGFSPNGRQGTVLRFTILTKTLKFNDRFTFHKEQIETHREMCFV